MAQAVETVSRRCMTRECLVNAAAAIGLVGAVALAALLWISIVLWFYGKHFWMW